MAGICTSSYPIKKFEDSSYSYLVNAGIPCQNHALFYSTLTTFKGGAEFETKKKHIKDSPHSDIILIN